MFHLDEQDTTAVARLVLDRPAACNAIPIEGWGTLAALADRAAASPARLLIVEGAGGAFCAGADLGDIAAIHGDPADAARLRAGMARAFAALAAIPFPTVARIEGPCFGAGVALTLACDLRFAGPAARFSITPARIGIGFPRDDVQRLVALVGRGQAARLLFGAIALDAAQAVAMGLADQAGDADAFAALVEDILAGAPSSHLYLKRAIAAAAPDPALDVDFDRLLAGDEAAERLAARRR